MSKIKKGDTVKMSDFCKQSLIANDSKEHVDEFGECEGIVLGPMFPGTIEYPEVDVRWKPSSLRYGYNSLTDLIKIK